MTLEQVPGKYLKTQKTPPGEIERAKRIMNEYFYVKKTKGGTNNE